MQVIHYCRLSFAIFFLFALTDRALGQSSIPVADTSSPRATLESFIQSCNEAYEMIQDHKYFNRSERDHVAAVRRVLDCLDTSEIPTFAIEERAAEVAVCLKEILDRHELPPWDEIPDAEDLEDPTAYQRLSRYRIPGTRITISRIEEGPQKHEYLFSAGTVDRAVEYYFTVASRPYRTDGPQTTPGFYRWYMSAPSNRLIGKALDYFPDSIRFGRVLGVALWKWPLLLILLVTAAYAMLLTYRRYLTLSAGVPNERRVSRGLIVLLPVSAVFLPLVVLYVCDAVLTIRGNGLYVLGFCAYAAATIASIVAVFAICNTVSDMIIGSPKINPKGLNAQLIRIASRLVSLALAVIVFMVGGQYLGIPVATLLTSAGIGGVALALGAQDTLKTLFGTVMLMADKPFRVGERIVCQGYDGVVEDIGLRSTRIRLLNSHQVSMPNDELARADIENVGRRKCIRRVANIHIPLDTPYEKTQLAVEIVRRELEDHEGMDPDFPPRVFFLDFLPDAFVIRAIYWYHPPDYWEYVAFSERFNFAVFQAFQQNGIQFALPDRITTTSLESEPAPLEVHVVNKDSAV